MSDAVRALGPIVEQLFERPQFSIGWEEKSRLLTAELTAMVAHHRRHSQQYARICDAIGVGERFQNLAAIPYLPVSLFKTHELRSVGPDEVFKVLTSSGTTGQAVSRVVLDELTSQLQSLALARIMRQVLGGRRLSMIVVDSKNVIKDRKMFSARGAGLLGMLPFGRDHFYALDDDMRLDVDGLRRFLDTRRTEQVLVFGFTFMVWKHFVRALADAGATIDLSGGILVHSGGWKRLVDESVSNHDFRELTTAVTALDRIHNFYGMVEQLGSVFMEGDDGYLYPPNFAEVIIRDPQTWSVVPHGTPGVIEVLSVLPRSYPGHALLTEDLGVVHGIGDGPTGWNGSKLEVLGRLPRSELRGCSDTFAYDRDRAA